LTNPTNPQGWPTGLFKFDPDKLTWNVLVEKEYIEQLSWSPDGKWIVFQSSENNLRDLYLIHPDGSDLTNLTKGAYTGEMDSFVGGGWLGNGYLYAFGNPSQAKLYLVNQENGHSKEFPVDFPPGKSQFLPSPDGKSIALVEISESGPTLKVFNASGKFVRQLANFQNISINLHSWSPDSKKLAFNGRGDTTDTVFIVGVDGSDFRQIYTGKTIGQVIFSPDGQYVLIEDMNETGERLYIYRMTKGEIRLLTAPGLNLTDNWRAPSWRP
jgi:Tol biopolymer transport system component